MTYRFKSLVVATLLSLTAGHSTVGQAQQMGGPSPGGSQGGPGGMPAPGGVGGPAGAGGMTGRESSPGPGFMRAPGGDTSPTMPGTGREPLPGSPPDFGSNRSAIPETIRVVPLSNVVSMVQERFNATAVKTDTIIGSGNVVYRIRLLSADKSRVWTVNVDARTGQVK